MEKEKIDLTGVNETLFVPLCARALESRKKNHAFYDAAAVRIMETMDCDVRKYGGSRMNMWGCAARTVMFDEQVRAHIEAYPDCSVINLACGLDDRFHRVDNGRIRWYNVDFADVMQLRRRLLEPNDRVEDIACSAFDYGWIDRIENREHALVLAEGFLMYVTAQQARELFTTIAQQFRAPTLLLELMTRWMVEHQKYHDTTKKTDVTFLWGVDRTEDFVKLCPQYRLEGEYNFTDGMTKLAPFPMLLIAPFLRSRNNRLGKFAVRPAGGAR